MNAPGRPLAVVLALLAACAGPASVARTAPPQRAVPAGKPAAADLDGPARVVVRSEAEWAELWNRMYAGRGAKVPPRPQVDFSRHMVLFATLGPRPGGYGARIADVAIDGGVLQAAVVERRPEPRCTVPGQRVAPAAIATVPRFDGPVRFADRVDVQPCR